MTSLHRTWFHDNLRNIYFDILLLVYPGKITLVDACDGSSSVLMICGTKIWAFGKE